MAPPPTRIGLVGVGDAATHHARAVAATPSATLAGVVARSPASWARFLERAPTAAGTPTFESLEALLGARACDAVILATPDALHAGHVRAAASAGVHVLCDKPLATSFPDGLAAARTCVASGVVLEVGYQLRHHAGHEVLRAAIPSRVGAVRHLAVRWAWPDPAVEGWRASGQAASDWSLSALGTHGVDLTLWLGGAPPVEVRALRAPPTGPDRAALVSLRLANGVLVEVSCAVTHREPSRLVVGGDLGTLEGTGTLGARGRGELLARSPRGEATPLAFTPVDPYAAQLAAFVEKVRARTVTLPLDALWNLAVLDATRGAPLPKELP